MYNIIRKHSDDSSSRIVETASNKAEARKYIKSQIKELDSNINEKHEVNSLDDVTNIKFAAWSIGYWFEKA